MFHVIPPGLFSILSIQCFHTLRTVLLRISAHLKIWNVVFCSELLCINFPSISTGIEVMVSIVVWISKSTLDFCVIKPNSIEA